MSEISRDESRVSDHTTERSEPDPDPVCPNHGAPMAYDNRNARWFCPKRPCPVVMLDPYEWDPDYDPEKA